MKYLIPFSFYYLIFPFVSRQNANDYFERIRNNSAELTAFFSEMPKGGDLHHHYSGSVCMQKPISIYVIDKDLFFNKSTCEVSDKENLKADLDKVFHAKKKVGTLAFYKQKTDTAMVCKRL